MVDATAAAVLQLRKEGKFEEASIALEAWVANCRKQTPVVAPPEMLGATGLTPPSKMGVLGKSAQFLARARSARQMPGVGEEEDGSTLDLLRERMPRLQRLVDREGSGSERLTFVQQVCVPLASWPACADTAYSWLWPLCDLTF